MVAGVFILIIHWFCAIISHNIFYFSLADFGSASMTSPANSFVGTPYWYVVPQEIIITRIIV